MCKIDVQSAMSAPRTCNTGPLDMPSGRTQESPMGFGRLGERDANTPSRAALPPSLGGRIVDDQPSPLMENCQSSQMWRNPSKPRTARSLRYSGSNATQAHSSSARPLCRGTPNLSGKSVYAPVFMCLFENLNLCFDVLHIRSYCASDIFTSLPILVLSGCVNMPWQTAHSRNFTRTPNTLSCFDALILPPICSVSVLAIDSPIPVPSRPFSTV